MCEQSTHEIVIDFLKTVFKLEMEIFGKIPTMIC